MKPICTTLYLYDTYKQVHHLQLIAKKPTGWSLILLDCKIFLILYIYYKVLFYYTIKIETNLHKIRSVWHKTSPSSATYNYKANRVMSNSESQSVIVCHRFVKLVTLPFHLARLHQPTGLGSILNTFYLDTISLSPDFISDCLLSCWSSHRMEWQTSPRGCVWNERWHFSVYSSLNH